MSKLTREQKIEIFKKKKTGYSVINLSNEYGKTEVEIKYLIRLIDYHGVDILRQGKNKVYSLELKEEIINEVLINGHSITSTAVKYGLLSKGMLTSWIKSYKENNYVIVEKTRGRSPTMIKKTISKKSYEDMTLEEKVKYLENKNLYLEAEVEYRKKLRAVVLARKNQQPKKK